MRAKEKVIRIAKVLLEELGYEMYSTFVASYLAKNLSEEEAERVLEVLRRELYDSSEIDRILARIRV